MLIRAREPSACGTSTHLPCGIRPDPVSRENRDDKAALVIRTAVPMLKHQRPDNRGPPHEAYDRSRVKELPMLVIAASGTRSRRMIAFA
jgi:hypothetical protein